MAGYGSVWAKINHADDLAFLQEHYNPKATLADGCCFACAKPHERDAEAPEGLMRELSERFGESVFMCVQTVVDFFVYSHWKDGELLRQIQYCADEGWYEVTGEQQDWELQLFNEKEKQRQLSYLDLEVLTPESAEYEEAQRLAAQIESVWAKQALQEESFYPMATASDIYGIVLHALKLANPYQ